jgi:DNA-binding NtrC family response regulator
MPDSPEVIVVAAKENPRDCAALLAAGCRTVLNSSLPRGSFLKVLDAIVAERRELAVAGPPVREVLAEPQLSDFVSDSPVLQAFMKKVHRVVQSDASLLILGETGVGKERLARAIHAGGPRARGPFVTVNCGALPESLLESELFGHEEGAFTGAARARRGLFELAHRGTVFLDEVGELPLHSQVNLLRVLQEHRIQRLGSETTLAVDVRVMAASNRDIDAEVESGRFRKDLYYRLNVMTLTVPPLRKRREDIPALVRTYLEYLRPEVGRGVTRIADNALAALIKYDWPGNVRELANVIERAMLLCNGEQIELDDLPPLVSGAEAPRNTGEWAQIVARTDVPQNWLNIPMGELRDMIVSDFERAYLTAQLRNTNGHVGKTAKRVGTGPRVLYEKMKKYGLRKEDFRRKRGTKGSEQ